MTMTKARISYKPLFKLLVDKEMKKKELCMAAGISFATMTKMGKGGHVTTEVLSKICLSLDCKLSDILEIVPVGEVLMKMAEDYIYLNPPDHQKWLSGVVSAIANLGEDG